MIETWCFSLKRTTIFSHKAQRSHCSLISFPRWATILPSLPATASQRTSPSGKVGYLIRECCSSWRLWLSHSAFLPADNVLPFENKCIEESDQNIVIYLVFANLLQMWDGKTSSGENPWRYYQSGPWISWFPGIFDPAPFWVTSKTKNTQISSLQPRLLDCISAGLEINTNGTKSPPVCTTSSVDNGGSNTTGRSPSETQRAALASANWLSSRWSPLGV